MEVLKKPFIRKILPQRRLDSHKGENGRVLIVGGSIDFFGAPILAGLGALYSGADLVTLVVPECNFEVSRSFYPDFIVRKYSGNYLNARALDVIHSLLEKTDALLMGPGLSKNEEALRIVGKILGNVGCPTVLDADALPAVRNALQIARVSPLIITPHSGEFEMIAERIAPDLSDEEKIRVLKKYAERWNTTILLKGPIDLIVPSDSVSHSDSTAIPSDSVHEIFMNETGNAGMTVGGTGDVLAGLITSLIAQKPLCVENAQNCNGVFEATCLAAYLNGLAGEMLFKQKGFAFSATDLALELPYAIRAVL